MPYEYLVDEQNLNRPEVVRSILLSEDVSKEEADLLEEEWLEIERQGY